MAPAHRADPVRVRQVLSNFLSNALKFTEQGSITVRAAVLAGDPRSQLVEFTVSDTGIGISEENQSRLFQPFAQADSATTRRYGGTGLGLSICRRLADVMGGTIAMESREGAGTTMRLRVSLELGDPAEVEAPLQLAPPKVAGRRPPSRRRALAEGSLLLLVEDHATNRLVLAKQFALAGFTLDIAVDGEKALALWCKNRYAVVFTDLHMPKMDGIALARAIRLAERQAQRPRTPIIALTAAAQREDSARCLEAGMDDVVIKPTTVPLLAAKLRQWLPGLPWQGDALPMPGPPPAAARDDGPGGFDRDVLTGLVSGNRAMLRDFVADFRQAIEGDLAALDASLGGGDAAGIARHAHRIRGASAIVGATEMASLCEQLERAGGLADWPAIRGARSRLAEAFRRLEPRLAALADPAAGARGPA